VRAVSWHPAEGFRRRLPASHIDRALAREGTLVWLDITDPQPGDMRLLRDEFGIHHLALEEVVTPHPRPKCAEYPGAYVMAMYATGVCASGEIDLREVVIYAGRRFLVTAHRRALPEIDECLRRWEANAQGILDGIAAPLYSLLDTLVDTCFPVVDVLAERIDEAEDRILAMRNGEGAPDIYLLKKDLLRLRRVVAGERDALNLLLRQDVEVIPPASALYFQSVYDHLVRLVESIDTYRDLVSNAMDIHLSVVSNRLNQVMKTLTAISTILMSTGLISGIYGMNFAYMPELKLRYGYYGALGLMALIALGLAAFFRRIRYI